MSRQFMARHYCGESRVTLDLEASL